MLAYNSTLCNRNLALSCSDGRELVTSSYDEVLAFLLQPCGEFGVTYNIDALVDNICSIMPKSLCDKVRKGGQVFTPENRKLYYQAGRLFGINHINIYGLSKYADEPITDCQKLLELGNKVIGAYRTFGIEPTKLTSPVAVYADVFDKDVSFPRACDLPETAFGMLENCDQIMTREWREVYALGHWNADEIADYDLCSSYPSLIAKLPDLRQAKFFESDTLPQQYSWGIMLGTLNITKPVSPFVYKSKNREDYYPIGQWDDLITTDELWLINRYQLGSFSIKHGWFYQLPKTYQLPFKATMQHLWASRSNTNPLVSKIAKAISVGVYGRFAQRFSDGTPGDDYNSVYACLTTSRNRVRVADFIYRNEMPSDVVSITVDGVLSTKILPIDNQNVLGSWRKNPKSNTLVVSQLFQWLSDKRPNMQYYDEIMAEITKHPNKAIYGNMDLNLLTRNRVFDKLPKTGGELLSQRYHSRPYVIKP